MSIIFIVNPVAGKGRGKLLVPLIRNICENYNIDYDVKFTSRPNEATDIARESAKNGVKRIIAVGGDGTLNEVINGVVNTKAAFGIIPGGTGNDFIRNLVKDQDIEKIIYGSIFGDIRPIDIAKCNDRYFINIASAGFDAEVTKGAQSTKKIFSGNFAYIMALIKTIFQYKGKIIKVEIDDNHLIEGRALLIAAANGKYYGGGILLAPQAKIEDGLFDIYFIKHLSIIKMLTLLPRFIKGNHENMKEVSLHRGKKVKLTSLEELSINIDGEISSNKELEFELIPKGISLVFPN